MRDLLDIPSQSGGYIMREMIRFAFFMRQPNLVIAPKIVEVIEELIDLFPPPQLTSFYDYNGDLDDYTAIELKKEVRKRLVGQDQAINGTINLCGNQANIPDFNIQYSGTAIDRPIFWQHASTLVFSIATSIFNKVQSICIPLLQKFAFALECSAAYVDLALEGNPFYTQKLAHQYQCIDMSSIGAIDDDIEDKLPGIFWKTYLNQSTVEQLGGLEVLKKGLSKYTQIEIIENDNLIITFGPELILGDVNQPEDYADRIWLAKIAHEKGLLHVPQRVLYFGGGHEFQNQWHLRFVQ